MIIQTRGRTTLAIVLALFGLPTTAAEIALYDWGFNLNGTLYCSAGNSDTTCSGNGVAELPGFLNTDAFDFGSGLGRIEARIASTGSHSVLAWFDHEIDETVNSAVNEFGSIEGTLPTGSDPRLQWEIDEPGYAFGDIYDNLINASLDNSNGVPAGSPDDVSVAMGWTFDLPVDTVATVSWTLGTDDDGSPFAVLHQDPQSPATIRLSTRLDIATVALPGSLPLAAVGLALLGLGRRRRRR
jgi:hypothetical protein